MKNSHSSVSIDIGTPNTIETSTTGYHTPVLVEESIQGLYIIPSGIYVDATFGGGGHSRAILQHLDKGQLIAFDQDISSAQEAEKIKHSAFVFCRANFRYITQHLHALGITQVHGILADLGVSSHQIDTAKRGFSTRYNGPLDMRMDKKTTLTASDIIASYTHKKLNELFTQYGELKNAKTVAHVIIKAREENPITTTYNLIEVLKKIAPRGRENQFFARVFQSLRIEINDELNALKSFLHQCGELLHPGGRLVVISYHSLEDRLVKRYMRTGNTTGELTKNMYGHKITFIQPVNKKPMVVNPVAVKKNSRSRSARLRVGEKIKTPQAT